MYHFSAVQTVQSDLEKVESGLSGALGYVWTSGMFRILNHNKTKGSFLNSQFDDVESLGLFTRPDVAEAVLQSPPSLIN